MWNEIRKLEGQTLRTLAKMKYFDIIEVTENGVTICPQATQNERSISRLEIENAFKRLTDTGQITRSEIQKYFSQFNPAYVAAILAELPTVQHSIRPIRLWRGNMPRESNEEKAARIHNKGVIIAAIITGLMAICAALIIAFFAWPAFQEWVLGWFNSPEPTITPLPSAEPTITPLTSPEPTIAPSLAPTLEIYFNDDFSSKSKYSWIFPNLIGVATSNARIERGSLIFTENCPTTNLDLYCTSYIHIPSINKNNFKIYFDVLYEQLTTGASSIIAVIFRVDPLNGNYYSAQFIFDGQCTLSEYYIGDTIGIKTEDIGLGYYPNLNTIYHYSLLVNNNRFTISIDGNVVVSEVNGDINAISPIYLYFYVSSGGIATINIDNLLITAP